MARGELLRKLFASFSHGDRDEFRAIALEIIAEEDRKQNHQLAKDLMRILENSSQYRTDLKPVSDLNSLPKDKERQTFLVEVRNPDRRSEDIVLTTRNRSLIQRIIEEYQKGELLRAHGLSPKNKLLFCGPPGCGKTLCAEIISQELGLPLLYARFDAIVSSYLGETAANLRKALEFASNGRWVVLFDEFDAIGKERDDPNEHGELKRVVNTFLQLLDSFQSPSLIIAATNHEKLLDTALWRRFDEVVYFPRPSVKEIAELLRMKLKNFPYNGLDLESEARHLKGMSYADVERVCLDAIKTCIIEDKDSVSGQVFVEAVENEKSRLRVGRQALAKKN